jgi:beta-lactam-binding protein with PASTA domain
MTPRGSAFAKWIAIAILLIALLAGASIGGVLWYRGSVAKVPSVIGLSPEAARTRLSLSGLTVAVSHSDTTGPEVPAGTIASQQPTAGKTVGRGSRVAIVVNGLEPVKVPSVVGRPQAVALKALQDAGLWIGTIDQVFNGGPVGTVISQDPTGTAVVLQRTPVAVTLSKGPKQASVPGVIGQLEATATAALARAGYRVTVHRQYDSTVPTGAVLLQSPLAGAALARGQTVSIVVTRGLQAVRVPMVLGSSIADAVTKIQAAGLKVRIVFIKSTANHIDGVTKLNPGQNTDMAPGDTVVVTIGIGGL